MFLIDNGLSPPHVVSKFTRLEDVSTRVTRSVIRGNFELPNYCLQQSRRNFVYRAIKTWELLPPTLKSITEVDSFVSGVKQWLLDGDVGII